MEKEIGSITIVSYDGGNLDHILLKRRLLEDEAFQREFGQMFAAKQNEIFCASDELEDRKAYFVKKDEDLIGMLRIFSQRDNRVNVQFAIAPAFRGNGYGKLLLTEFANYLFENGVELIEGEVEKNNRAGIKIVDDLGYQKVKNMYTLRRQ